MARLTKIAEFKHRMRRKVYHYILYSDGRLVCAQGKNRELVMSDCDYGGFSKFREGYLDSAKREIVRREV